MALVARRVYRSLNERFSIAGYNAGEAAAVFFALYFGVSFVGAWFGLGTGALGILLMSYGKRRDPKFFEMILMARRFNRHLDAIRSSEVTWYTKRS